MITHSVNISQLRDKLRLWRTLFIHRWHAPQTIGELHGRPSVGMRFEHINHRESLTQYVWRYGAFRENDAATGRQDMSDKPSRANGLQAIIKELESQTPGLLPRAIEYAIFKYGNPDVPVYTDRIRQHSQELDLLASQYPAIPAVAEKLYRLHREMLPFYYQMRYLTKEEATRYADGENAAASATSCYRQPGKRNCGSGRTPFSLPVTPSQRLERRFPRISITPYAGGREPNYSR